MNGLDNMSKNEKVISYVMWMMIILFLLFGGIGGILYFFER